MFANDVDTGRGVKVRRWRVLTEYLRKTKFTSNRVEGHKYIAHPPSAGSAASAGRIQINGIESTIAAQTTDDSISPVDSRERLTFQNMDDSAGEYEGVAKEEGDEEESPNGDAGKGNIGAMQQGVIEMSTLITQPAMKRAESLEILHLTLHQVSRLLGV